MKKINIGCGLDVKKYWDNLDTHNKNGANIIWDLNNLPLPFENNIYDYVLCSHVIEDWTNPILIIKELIRICKIEGKIEIRVPHERSANAWGSIAHKKAFNVETLTSFLSGKKDYKNNEYYLPVELISCICYSNLNWNNKIVAIYKYINIRIRNAFGLSIERVPFFRNISTPDMSIKCIYKKVAPFTRDKN